MAKCIDDDQRGGRAEIFYIEDDPKNPEFWGLLGGYVDPATLSAGEPDTEVSVKTVLKLFKIVDGEAVLEHEGLLKKAMLLTENIYLLHSTDKISLWVGKGAKLETKKAAMAVAVAYVKKVMAAPIVTLFESVRSYPVPLFSCSSALLSSFFVLLFVCSSVLLLS